MKLLFVMLYVNLFEVALWSQSQPVGGILDETSVSNDDCVVSTRLQKITQPMLLLYIRTVYVVVVFVLLLSGFPANNLGSLFSTG